MVIEVSDGPRPTASAAAFRAAGFTTRVERDDAVDGTCVVASLTRVTQAPSLQADCVSAPMSVIVSQPVAPFGAGGRWTLVWTCPSVLTARTRTSWSPEVAVQR